MYGVRIDNKYCDDVELFMKNNKIGYSTWCVYRHYTEYNFKSKKDRKRVCEFHDRLKEMDQY